MTMLDALKVGCAQCLRLIPGTSRSGATIIGGMLFGLSRKAATEFSFFLAIPTLLAATVYSVFKARHCCHGRPAAVRIGGLAAFVSAFLCVRWLCATSARTTSRSSPGTVSCSASSSWSPRITAGELGGISKQSETMTSDIEKRARCTSCRRSSAIPPSAGSRPTSSSTWPAAATRSS
jgi:hypothetical protein